MTKIKVIYRGNLRTEAIHESGAILETDAPKDNQGQGASFSPTDLLGVSLSTCMLTLMGIAARKLGVDLKDMTAEVEKQMSLQPRRIGKLIVRIRSSALPNASDRAAIEQAALTCPVHASLHPDIKKEVDFVWGL